MCVMLVCLFVCFTHTACGPMRDMAGSGMRKAFTRTDTTLTMLTAHKVAVLLLLDLRVGASR